MTILAIDTASDRFAVAVDRDGRIDSLEADAGLDHSRLLLPAITQLLGEDRLEGIVVVTGPGAYAGVRVGIATAEGLALARAVPVHGIGTLEAVALAAGITAGTVIHPAGRGEFAAQDVVDGVPAGSPRIARAEDLREGVAGEGARAAGGREVTPRERCEAALRARAGAIRAGAPAAGIEAFYLREPSITISRRKAAAP